MAALKGGGVLKVFIAPLRPPSALGNRTGSEQMTQANDGNSGVVTTTV